MLIFFVALWFKIGAYYQHPISYLQGYNHKQIEDMPSPGYKKHKTSIKYQKERILQKGYFGNKTESLIKLGVKIS
jgi:hypothetical protein